MEIKDKYIWAIIIAYVATILIALLIAPKTAATNEVAVEPQIVEEKAPDWTFDTLMARLADKYGVDESLAREIVKCESTNKENAVNNNYTDDGIHWSSDHGYFQFNDYYHEKEAKQRGFDIKVWEDNLEYGFIKLKEEGTWLWDASKHCWDSV